MKGYSSLDDYTKLHTLYIDVIFGGIIATRALSGAIFVDPLHLRGAPCLGTYFTNRNLVKIGKSVKGRESFVFTSSIDVLSKIISCIRINH